MFGRSSLLAAGAVAAALAACAPGGGAGDGQRRALQPGAAPALASAACPDVIRPSERVECYEIAVPADRADPGAGEVVLPVVVLRSAAATVAPDPVVYLSGGPGLGALAHAAPLFATRIFGDRDIVLFDQRGTGWARPSLDCPEVDDAIDDVLGAAAERAQEVQRAADALAVCRQRLEADGVDMDDYDTPAIAADVEDIRRALGVREWNLFGVSYGTTVALEVLRRHGEHVRAVVLDSAYPPDLPATVERLAQNAERAFNALFDACAGAPACAESFGDLALSLDALVAEWNATPWEQTVDGRDLVITGDDAAAGLWSAMYDTRAIPLLPAAIATLRQRGPATEEIVADIARAGIGALTRTAEAMGVSVECADRGRLGAGAPLEEVVARHPRVAGLVALAASARRCDLWEVAPVGASFNQPIASEVPALVLAGEFDPVTPPADGERVAGWFAQARLVLLPAGHGLVFSDRCADEVVEAFVAEPTRPLDTTCADASAPISWAGAAR